MAGFNLVPERFGNRLNLIPGLPETVRRYSVTGDGVTDDYNALREVAAKFGTTGHIYFPAGTYRVGTSLTFNCLCEFAPGATFDPDSGVTVTLAGPIRVAPGSSIVAAGTTGTVSITGAMDAGSGDFNVKAFGAVGDGVTDDRAAIQAALDSCDAAGGGVVFLPEGTYLISPRVEPTSTVTVFCLRTYSNVTMRGAGAGATRILLDVVTGPPSGAAVNWLMLCIMTEDPFNGAAPKYNVGFEDFTFDGQSNNQSVMPPNAQHAIFVGSTRRAWHTRVVVKNFYGIGAAPPDETFCFSVEESADVHYADCQAFTDDGGNTSTGFSGGNSTNVTYTGCVAHDMTNGMGFTSYLCSLFRYVNCSAYNIGYAGFNTEISQYVAFTGCQSGGRTQDAAGSVLGDQVEIGNRFGFKVLGSREVNINGCVSAYNQTSTGYGVYISSFTGPIVSQGVLIDGCFIRSNDVGIHIEDGSQAYITLTPNNSILSNGTFKTGSGDFAIYEQYADAPYLRWTALNGTSGLRFDVAGGQDAFTYRFLKAGTEMMRFGYAGALGLPDGITAPGTDAGRAWLYVDAADGDLKIKFGDGTVKTIVVDT